LFSRINRLVFIAQTTMYFLIYSSYKTSDFTADELKALLVQSRQKNSISDITGMLLLCGWQFVQMLEGEEKNVKLLYHHICNDDRHKSIVLLKEGFMESRVFSDWSMGFNTVSSESFKEIEGYQRLNAATALQLFKKLSES